MVDLFSSAGPDLDRGYLNLQADAHPIERELRQSLEALWAVYEPYADPNFAAEFARKPDTRFWEIAFLDEQFKAVSGVIWSRASIRQNEPDRTTVEPRP